MTEKIEIGRMAPFKFENGDQNRLHAMEKIYDRLCILRDKAKSISEYLEYEELICVQSQRIGIFHECRE